MKWSLRMGKDETWQKKKKKIYIYIYICIYTHVLSRELCWTHPFLDKLPE